ncbi:MAG: hypothetical protein ACREP6_02515, partial [Candidatus Binataceae bacterium]
MAGKIEGSRPAFRVEPVARPAPHVWSELTGSSSARDSFLHELFRLIPDFWRIEWRQDKLLLESQDAQVPTTLVDESHIFLVESRREPASGSRRIVC